MMKNVRINYFLIFFVFLSMFFNAQTLLAAHSKPKKGSIYFSLYKDTQADIKGERKKTLLNDLHSEAIEYLFEAAQHGDAEAMDEMFIQQGWIVSVMDAQKVKITLQNLIDNGNSFAAFFALHKQQNFKINKIVDHVNNPLFIHTQAVNMCDSSNIDNALALLDKNIARNFWPSLRLKAQILTKLNKTDLLKEAISLYRFLMSHGDITSYNNLAHLLMQYPQFSKFEGEHISLFKYASLQGNIIAMCNLAQIYADKDTMQAKKYLAMARIAHEAKPQKEIEPLLLAVDKIICNLEKSEELGHSLTPEAEPFKACFFPGSSDFVATMSSSISESERLHCFLRALEALQEELVQSDGDEDELASQDEEKVIENSPRLAASVEPKRGEEKATSGEIDNRAETTDKVSITMSAPPPPQASNTMEKQASIKKPVQPKDTASVIPTVNLSSTTNSSSTTTRTGGSSSAPQSDFARDLGARLLKVRDMVESILNNQSISNKDMRKLFNMLKIGGPGNIKGSHQKTAFALDDTHHVNKIFIRAHKKSSIHTNSKKLKEIFNEFGIFSAHQLWPE